MPRFGHGYLNRQGLGHGLDAAVIGPVPKAKSSAAASFSVKFDIKATAPMSVVVLRKVGATFTTVGGFNANIGAKQTLSATFAGKATFKATFKIAQQVEGATFETISGFKAVFGTKHQMSAVFAATSGFMADFVGEFPFAPKGAGTLRLEAAKDGGQIMVAVMSKSTPYSAKDQNEIWLLEHEFGTLTERLF